MQAQLLLIASAGGRLVSSGPGLHGLQPSKLLAVLQLYQLSRRVHHTQGHLRCLWVGEPAALPTGASSYICFQCCQPDWPIKQDELLHNLEATQPQICQLIHHVCCLPLPYMQRQTQRLVWCQAIGNISGSLIGNLCIA